jgi:HAD superfamily hydrolase (TIGR01450 family)
MTAISRTPAQELLADARDYLFDLDGCIWFGSELAPGAAELVRQLRDSGRRALFLTNNSGATSESIAEKLGRLGIPATPAEVVAPLTVLTRHPALEGGGPAQVVGSDMIRQTLAAAGIPLAEEPEDAAALVVGNTRALTYQDVAAGMRALDAGAEFLALNADRRLPVEGGRFLPGSGAIVAAISTASLEQRQATLIGKPTRFFFDQALELFGATPATAVMIGDTPETDILGGRRAGLRTVQVGELVPESDEARPDLHLSGVHELLTLI